MAKNPTLPHRAINTIETDTTLIALTKHIDSVDHPEQINYWDFTTIDAHDVSLPTNINLLICMSIEAIKNNILHFSRPLNIVYFLFYI